VWLRKEKEGDPFFIPAADEILLKKVLGTRDRSGNLIDIKVLIGNHIDRMPNSKVEMSNQIQISKFQIFGFELRYLLGIFSLTFDIAFIPRVSPLDNLIRDIMLISKVLRFGDILCPPTGIELPIPGRAVTTASQASRSSKG
jgi:hypothetical protein